MRDIKIAKRARTFEMLVNFHFLAYDEHVLSVHTMKTIQIEGIVNSQTQSIANYCSKMLNLFWKKNSIRPKNNLMATGQTVLDKVKEIFIE